MGPAPGGLFFAPPFGPLAFLSRLRLNKGMTASEKTRVARFLDLASDMIRDGYRSGERDYRFTDDPAAPQTAAVSPPLALAEEMIAAEPAPPYGGENGADSLEGIAGEIRACTACALGGGGGAVPGDGAARPLVLVICGSPDAASSGRAGELLDKMLASIGLSRERNCFISSLVKCRPPNGRDPLPEERGACASFLERQIRVLRPKRILCAGEEAARSLLNTREPLEKLRGRFRDFSLDGGTSAPDRPSAPDRTSAPDVLSIPLLATYHPGALLENEGLKRPAWEDLKLLRAGLED
jgi:DNA polymerase